jgi:hypothetical protein
MPDQTEETRRDWEVVQKNNTDVTERLRVINGWLYRTIVNGPSANAVAMVFVPGLAD